MHCSFLDQITATATALHGGSADLLLLSIDEDGLPVVVEDSFASGEPYPHVYGPVPRTAVASTLPFPCFADGSFALPPELSDEEVPLPPIVARVSLFAQSSLPVVGRLLARLVAAAPGGTVAELGTGTGHAAARVASALRTDQRFVTVEADRANAAREVLTGMRQATVLDGEWEAILDHGPFVTAFVDAPGAKDESADRVLAAMTAGGVVVLDDLTPRHLLDREVLASDPVRRRWLHSPGIAGVERQVTPRQSVIVTRVE